MITVYVRRCNRHKYRYLASWEIYHSYFSSMAEISEYFSGWGNIQVVDG